MIQSLHFLKEETERQIKIKNLTHFWLLTLHTNHINHNSLLGITSNFPQDNIYVMQLKSNNNECENGKIRIHGNENFPQVKERVCITTTLKNYPAVTLSLFQIKSSRNPPPPAL